MKESDLPREIKEALKFQDRNSDLISRLNSPSVTAAMGFSNTLGKTLANPSISPMMAIFSSQSMVSKIVQSPFTEAMKRQDDLGRVWREACSVPKLPHFWTAGGVWGEMENRRANIFKAMGLGKGPLERSGFQLPNPAESFCLKNFGGTNRSVQAGRSSKLSGIVFAGPSQRPPKKLELVLPQRKRGIEAVVEKLQPASNEKFATIMTKVGYREPATREQVKQILANMEGYDFIIDGINRKAIKRESDKYREARLTPSEYEILTGYIQTGTIRRPCGLRSINRDNRDVAIKIFESARRKADRRLQTGNWVLFKTHSVPDSSAKAYRFSPPEDISWILIDPICN